MKINEWSLPYLGKVYEIHLSFQEEVAVSCAEQDSYIAVFLPAYFLHQQTLAIKEAETTLRLWMRKKARDILSVRISQAAEKMGVVPKRVQISSAKRQWGSCSYDNVIRLNWRLIMLPLEIVDYVITHELAHIKYKDHQNIFWRYVEQYMPDYSYRRKRLRAWERDCRVMSVLT